MSIQYTMPIITAAVITPNPADINSAVKISLTITEKTVTLSEELIYSGEIQSGEAQ